MKVTLQAYGGLAAAVNAHRPPCVVDAAALPAEAARTLAGLVEAAAAAPAVVDDQARQVRDAVTYKITVDRNGSPLVLTQSDATMSIAFAALLDWVDEHSG